MHSNKIKMVLFAFSMCLSMVACGDTVKEYGPSDLYNNKEDKEYNRHNNDDTGYVSDVNELDVLPNTDEITATPTPIEIKTTVELTPTPTIEEETKNYTGYTIKQDDFVVFVPLIGNFVEARLTETFTPTNNENEINLFWEDKEDLTLATIVVKKNETINEAFFDNYFVGLNETYKSNPSARNLVYSGLKTYVLGEYEIKYYSISVDILEGSATHYITKELCYIERDGYYIYSLLSTTLDEPPVIIDSIIETMYPIILEYEVELEDIETEETEQTEGTEDTQESEETQESEKDEGNEETMGD